jgi:hypothetical protein
MYGSLKNPAIKRYMWRFGVAITLYVAFLCLAVWEFRRGHPTGAVAYALAILPSIPIIGTIVAVGMYLAEEKDEFQRTVLVQSMLWGIGATLAVTSVWGLLENFVSVPHLDLFLVYPLFWAIVGMSAPVLKARYR